MQHVSTLTQKGQVTLPLDIRNFLQVIPSSKVAFEIKDNRVLVKKVPSIREMFGVIKTNKVITKKQMKKIISDAVVEKFKRKNA